MAYDTEDRRHTALDIVVERLRALLVQEPVGAGVAAGILAGGLANSGIVVFVTAAIVWVFGVRLQRGLGARSP